MNQSKIKRVGIVGFGNLGKYLFEEVQGRDNLEVAFVWNRNKEAMKEHVLDNLILNHITDLSTVEVDLIVEVCHPAVVAEYGELFLGKADFMVGSPTAFADPSVESRLRQAANTHGCYIPSGALWGGEDIRKMADRGTLKGLKITMTKHPSSFKLQSPLKEKNEKVTERTVLYEGSVSGLCPLAPNNVNTMAAAAIAAHNLGFQGVVGSIVSDPSLESWHYVDVDVFGPGTDDDNRFHIHTHRANPARVGAVTGNATYASFLSSVLGAHGKGPGIHLC